MISLWYFALIYTILSIFAEKAPRPKDMNSWTEITEEDLNKMAQNWTTCEEFLNNTEFDIKRIVDVDWKIFYFWALERVPSYNIRFSIPAQTLIHRFSQELPALKPPVNWTAAELFMETTIDFSALFVKVNATPGLYRLVPSLSFDITGSPWILFGLKVVDPGYLALLCCEKREVYALAPADSMPPANEIAAAAAKFHVRNDLNWSYLETEVSSLNQVPLSNNELDDRDEILVYDAEDDPKELNLI